MPDLRRRAGRCRPAVVNCPNCGEVEHEDEDCEGGCIREPDYEQMEADRIEALYDRLGYEG